MPLARKCAAGVTPSPTILDSFPMFSHDDPKALGVKPRCRRVPLVWTGRMGGVADLSLLDDTKFILIKSKK
jgi:hypothetical protein